MHFVQTSQDRDIWDIIFITSEKAESKWWLDSTVFYKIGKQSESYNIVQMYVSLVSVFSNLISTCTCRVVNKVTN